MDRFAQQLLVKQSMYEVGNLVGELLTPVMLNAAKHLSADRDRPFAALRVTAYTPFPQYIVERGI